MLLQTDWFGAKQFCEVQGMELVSFERASEMRAIWQLADASKECELFWSKIIQSLTLSSL